MKRMAIAIVCTAAAACSSSRAPLVGTLSPDVVFTDGSTGSFTVGTGTCPVQGDAALCPELGDAPAWVGCTRLAPSTNTAAFQSCTCFATESGGGAWICTATDAGPPGQDAAFFD